MRLDVAKGGGVGGFGQDFYQVIRSQRSICSAHQARTSREILGGCAHSAALGVSEQSSQIGRACEADPDLVLASEIADATDPAVDSARVEAELRDDM